MKKFLRILLAALLIVVLAGMAGCGTKNEQGAGENAKTQTVEKVRIGLDSHPFSLQFRVANYNGYFKKYGIEPEITTFSYGIDTLNAALANQTDTAIGMDYATLTRLAKGNLRVVSLINSPKSSNNVLIAKGDINTPEDLKGKRVGVGKGTVNEYIWARTLGKYKIDKSEITLEPLQSAAEILTAFDRGDVVAGWFDTAFLERALNVEGAKKLIDLSAIDFRMRGYFVVQDSYLKEKPEVVANIFKALDEASKFIKENPEETAEIAFKDLKLPKEGVLAELDLWDFDVRLSQEDVDHLKNVKDWTVANGLIQDQYDLKEKIVVEPLQKALPDKVTYKP